MILEPMLHTAQT